jgi:hypothetical protein
MYRIIKSMADGMADIDQCNSMKRAFRRDEENPRDSQIAYGPFKEKTMIERSMTTGVITGLLISCVMFLVSDSQVANAQGDALAYCKADAARICPGVQPGGGRLIGCLKQHENDVSVGCAKALQAIKAKMGK